MARKLQRAFAILLTLALLITTGCSTESQNSGAQNEGGSGSGSVIHIANDEDPGSLAPWGAEGARNYPVSQLYETLIHKDVDNEIQYILAKEIDHVEAYVYDVTIFNYIHDTAGNHLDANDVAFSFEMMASSGYLTYYISCLDHVDVTGDYTLRFTLKEDTYIGAFELMLEKVRVVTKAAWEQSGDDMVENPIGTMPYKLTKYVPGSYVLFEKTNNYWQIDASLISVYAQSSIDKVYIDIIPDRATQAIALQAGEIDASQFINPADMTSFIDDAGDVLDGYNQVIGYNSSNYGLIFTCSNDSPCSDINLRMAIAYGVDKSQIAHAAKGIDGIAVNYHNNPRAADFDPGYDNTTFSYDVEKAKQYLAQSSYNGEVLVIVVDNSVPSDASTLLAAQLQAFGINTEVQSFEYATAQSIHLDNFGTLYDIDFWAGATTGYSWSNMDTLDSTRYDNGMSHIVIPDDKLQELYNAMAGINTNSMESTAAFMDYVTENCYRVPLYVFKKHVISNAKVETLVTSNWYDIIPGACVISS